MKMKTHPSGNVLAANGFTRDMDSSVESNGHPNIRFSSGNDFRRGAISLGEEMGFAGIPGVQANEEIT